ncbi:MAG: 50S ribosomal protein L15 [Chloroflexi bacterium]|nr:50S ribosomal protein L15 [Chloroflexota bacterium]
MQQHELRQPKGATHKRKRIGRGNASGHGTYATRGMKGQKARAGGGVRPGFEGGQLPLVRRMAYKRGFRNPFRIDYEEVNVGALARFEANTRVDAGALALAKLVRTGRPVKVLGTGDLSVALTVEAASFSKSAREKIEAAGGSVFWLNGEPAASAEEEAPPATKTRAPKAAAEAPADASTQAPPPKARKPRPTTSPEASTGEAAGEEAPDGAGS